MFIMASRNNASNVAVFCTACNKIIQSTNTRRVLCNICKQWRHLKCTSFLTTDIDPICPKCVDEIFPFCQIIDDNVYKAAICNYQDQSVIDFSLLNEIKLEFTHTFASPALVTDDDLDADTNYYNALLNMPSKYCDTTVLNKTIPSPQPEIAQCLMHINARSLSKNIHALTTELSLLTNQPSVIAVTETWTRSDNDPCPIPGYTSILKSRKDKLGGEWVYTCKIS